MKKGVTPMRRFAFAAALFLTSIALWPVHAADGTPPPDFQLNGVSWIAMNNDLASPPTGLGPTQPDPAHPYVPNGRNTQPTFRIGNTSNPNLKPWAVERMKKDNAEVLAGKIAFTARSSCMPAGVPGFSSYIVEPIYFIQSPKEILMVYAGNQEARHIYMNVPHSPNPKPSWYGESVGHYEGDRLIVDTIGMNAKTYVDNYRTPHTEKLHVVERYRLVEDGKILEADITVDDPDTFNQPWSAIQRYRRVQQGPIYEQACAENNSGFFDYGIPKADKPDF
jgi:hypothetical protein